MSLLNNKYIEFSLYRDTDLEAFYDIDTKYRWSIIFSHMMIHFLPVLLIMVYFWGFFGDQFIWQVLAITLLFYIVIILETTAYMFPSSRKVYKRYFPWFLVALAIFAGYGSYVIGIEIGNSNSEISRPDILLTGLFGGFSVFIWTYLGMSLILKASRAIYTKKAAIEADVRFATEVQKKILQDVNMQYESICAYAKSVPANELGGDFFELTRRDDAIFACVGDVSGHSFGAGLLMTMTKSALQTHLVYNHDPASIAGALNKLFLNQSDRSMYSTMSLLKYDTSTLKALLCNAGHLPVFHYSREQDTIEERYEKGLGLGMISSAGYQNQEFEVQKGDILFLFSDGVVETRDEDANIRDMDTFKQIINQSIQKDYRSTAELTEIIFDEVRQHDYADKFEDDASLIILEA